MVDLVSSKPAVTDANLVRKTKLIGKLTGLIVVDLRPFLASELAYLIPVVSPPSFVAGVEVLCFWAPLPRVVDADDFAFRGARFFAVFSGEAGAGGDTDEGASAPSGFFSRDSASPI